MDFLPRLRSAVVSRELRFRARLRELVEVESPSDDPAAVDRTNALVASWAEELGGRAERHPCAGFGDALELRFGPEAGEPVLLLGHLDTVWPIGTLAGMPFREEGARIHGPGTVDMKAGVVMAFEAMAAVQAIAGSLPRPITLLLNPDEEVGSTASRTITERLALASGAVFVLEPAQGLAYKTSRKGVGHWTLRVEGVASHAGVDFERGRSAVVAMAALVGEIATWTDLGRGLTLNPGVLAGGTRSNVVAAECLCEVDGRVVTMADAAFLEERFAGLRAPTGCKLTVSGGINRPPMERGDGTVRLFRRAQEFAAGLGVVLDEASTGGGSDGNFTAALGVPTLDGMGAVGAGAHAAHEHIELEPTLEHAALLAAMLVG